MRYKIVALPQVKNDLTKANSYYKTISKSLAKAFLSRIKEGKNYITTNPYGDDIVYKNVRLHKIR